MTKEQAIAAIENLVKEKTLYKNSLVYKTIMEAIDSPGQPVVCGKYTGSGRFSGAESWQFMTGVHLDAAGIKYEKTNVSMRSGRAGDRITVFLD